MYYKTFGSELFWQGLPTQHLPSYLGQQPQEQKESETDSPTVHSHGCNCSEIASEWYKDWFEGEDLKWFFDKPKDVDEDIWNDVMECNSLRNFFRKKRSYALRSTTKKVAPFHEFAKQIFRLHGHKCNHLVSEILRVLCLERTSEDTERTWEFEDKVDSLLTGYGDLKLDVYHNKGHWSSDCYACSVEHETLHPDWCHCKICGPCQFCGKVVD